MLDKGTLDAALVHPEGWYAEHGVDLHTSTPVTAIDPAHHQLTAAGATSSYSQLVLATGSRARHLPLADDSGAEVHYLRQWDDAERLRAALTEGSRLGIIGGGWIGLEVASAARKHGVEVVILEMAPQPLHAVLGDEVAALFADLHRAHGVDLRTGVKIGGIRGTADGAEIEVDGDVVTVDRLVVGIGAVPDVSASPRPPGSPSTSSQGACAPTPGCAPARTTSTPPATSPTPTTPCSATRSAWSTGTPRSSTARSSPPTCWATRPSTTLCRTSSPTSTTSAWSTSATPGPRASTRWSCAAADQRGDDGGQFTAWWLRGGTVVAGMHVNDWDATDHIRRVVGTDVERARLADESVPRGPRGPGEGDLRPSRDGGRAGDPACHRAGLG